MSPMSVLTPLGRERRSFSGSGSWIVTGGNGDLEAGQKLPGAADIEHAEGHECEFLLERPWRKDQVRYMSSVGSEAIELGRDLAAGAARSMGRALSGSGVANPRIRACRIRVSMSCPAPRRARSRSARPYRRRRGDRIDHLAVLVRSLAQARERDRQFGAGGVDDAGVTLHRLDRRKLNSPSRMMA